MNRPLNDSVVVTGGAGFIGRTVVRALRTADYRVTVVDRIPSTERGVTMLVGDLRDAGVRDRTISEGAAAIVHLAAATSVVGSTRCPEQVFEDNVGVTAALLELARRRGAGCFVLASTNAVVGDAGQGVIDETTPLRPLTPYGATKAAAEMLLCAYRGSYGLPTCSLRLTNVYGPGMSHKDTLVARLMHAARTGASVPIYGDGEQRRDFVHVRDVAKALLLSVRLSWSDTVVIGSGRSVTVLEVVEAVRRMSGQPIRVEHVAGRAGEMPVVEVDISRARELGYEPAIGFEGGLRGLWDEARASWATLETSRREAVGAPRPQATARRI